MLRQAETTLVGNDRFEGFVPDLLKTVFHNVGLKYSIKMVADGSYGSELPDGTWNGMIGEVIREVRSNVLCQAMFESILINLRLLNFHPLEVVSRYRDPQLQVRKNTYMCKILETYIHLTKLMFNNHANFLV